ncbi:KilA-N domain-containing protein [Flavilitoribacter nigricans]|uniref:DNA-binding protein n=1 Tax=Flavilitoribacter nigricans (strain ATCC 23147 / DSM 23189 / NBRC 102662 / NCIMB 1420 / SS-2) TaxID=1122177 RepID=A0A2D0N2I4_FLAN2|nr:KilA-N domain-containing protein [Flavilitoribacter nigricans]PHN02339.1 DNA-binding protein [Flavilitoribacter nigricans DSM 23189 = NBRC 102662]
MAKRSITVQETLIRVSKKGDDDYVCLTDMCKNFDADPYDLLKAWLRNRSTVEFLGVWESIHNPDFNPVEFDRIRANTGLGSFVLTVKQWTEGTNAIGIESKQGRYGGTYAHKDIAIQFATYLSPTFYLYMVKEFQRLQEERKESLEWDVRRILTKINYQIHNTAVKSILPNRITKDQASIHYASEADLLNLALFGQTAREWRRANPDAKGNMRDHASPEQLVVLANLEAINAELIREGLSQSERLQRLNEIAIYQMQIIVRPGGRDLDPGTDVQKLK